MLGPNLPHVFRCSDKYYKKDKTLRAHGLSVYFLPHSFGKDFFDLPEAKKLKKLIAESSRGLIFSGKTAIRAKEMIRQLKSKQGFEKLCLLLEILRLLSESNERTNISGVGFFSPLGDENNKRLHTVFDFLANNFHKEIKLESLSDIAGMRPTALCRFFKLRTRKTIFRFLIELRIDHACKLLDVGKKKVADVAWECGYRSISNFNRQFLLITGFTPRKYTEQKKLL
jgi:AraC-like DNA-binding protein